MKTLTKIFLVSTAVAFIAVKWRPSHFDPESLRGARVLVTGASTGIGEQMAYHYARFGAQIVITARREKVLQQVVEKCLSLGAQKALYIAGDMATESDPDKVVEFSLEKLGGLDYLVLNHIGPTPLSMWKGDIEYARWLMKVVHVWSYESGTSKGSLVIVSSLLGKVPGPFTAPYSATKCALNGFFGSLQHELAMKNSNVSVSICTLGLIDTEGAMTAIKLVGIVTNLPASPASEAALNIIKTGATRQAELYYPWKIFIMTLTKDWSSTQSHYNLLRTVPTPYLILLT
uniref:Hydroxysteroid 11-beta-dehydrogenase 1-like protein n=1 Tax=Neogobius melanostomus TaxID=47308 RepID=A0A8C6SW31_9GOBI